MSTFDPTLVELFSQEEENVLYTALREAARQECAIDIDQGFSTAEEAIYDFLADTPKTSFVAILLDMVHNLGYQITKK